MAAEILLADERLTMSANMAAATGDRRWVDRYDSFLPDIAKAIDAANEMSTLRAREQFDKATRVANDNLVEMEQRSFAAVAENDLQVARSILNSKSYAFQKQSLADGTTMFLQSLAADRAEHVEKVQHTAKLLLCILIAVGSSGFALLWVLMRKKLSVSRDYYQNAEQRLAFMAQHDELTGLANRRTFEERTSQLLRATEENGGGLLAVAMIDIDHFKQINDSLGHQSGDEVLRVMTQRMQGNLAADSVLARFGGDEFALAVRIADESVADRQFNILNAVCSVPFEIDGQTLAPTISIGAAFSPTHACTTVDLLRMADIALYEGKSQGRNRTVLFEPSLDERQKIRQQLETDLKLGLARGEFDLHYQPLMSSDGQRITGLEALLRWPHPTNGMVSPAEFIPVAEQSDLILRLGEWVLQRAFEDSKRWPHIRIAINLSALQLRDPTFLETVRRLAKEVDADPRQFEFEITESLLLHDNGTVRALLTELRELGFGFSLDDFGTGYSSLTYLSKFAFDKIKIDQTFIKSIETSANAAQIVHSVVNLGRGLGLTVTAEGVETDAQHRFLVAAGCQQMQGFLFARPSSADVIDDLIQRDINGGETVAAYAA